MNPQASQTAASGPVLQDIHMPPAPSWWPLAPAWWIVIVVLLLLLAVTCYFVWRWRRRHRAWQSIANELDQLDSSYRETQETAPLASGLSQLLRRAVVQCGGDAHLHGAAWHAELTRLAADKLSATLVAELSQAQYRPHAVLDGEQALQACRSWLRQATRRVHA